MKPETLPLWQGPVPLADPTRPDDRPVITVYRPATPTGASVVICPGGGYGGLALEPEGHGIARWLNRSGIAGIVLQYRMPYGNPLIPLADVQRAIRITRHNAVAWQGDPKRIGVLGFSAGGHLASTAGTQFDEGHTTAADPVDRVSCRPDFMILVYPVITMGREKGHAGSRLNLLGPDPSPDTLDLFSSEKQVTARTPPAFVAHARDDAGVVPDNSRMFRDALLAHGVSAEYLELPSGGHGLNGYQGPSWDAWQARSLEWLKEQGFMMASRPRR